MCDRLTYGGGACSAPGVWKESIFWEIHHKVLQKWYNNFSTSSEPPGGARNRRAIKNSR